MIYFTSDLHLGHKSICKYRDKFKTPEEHDEYILNKMQELKKRDILYIIGDFLFDCEQYDTYIQRIEKDCKCRIKLIMGNHDSKKLYKLREDSRIELQLPLFCYKSMWISHCPIHPDEIRDRKGCIHGHLHKSIVQKPASSWSDPYLSEVPDKKYFNVNLDVNDYKFVSLDTIKDYFNKTSNLIKY